MSNLPARNETISTLSLTTQEVLKSRENKKIAEYAGHEIDGFIRTLLAETIYRMGLKNLETETLMVITSDLKESFETKYKSWPLDEIRLACKMGALGELPTEKDFGLSSRIIFNWIKVYAETVRTQAMQEISKLKAKQEREMLALPKSESKEDAQAFLDFCFAKWKETGFIPIAVYATAEKLELLKLTNDDKLGAMHEALERVKKTLHDGMLSGALARELVKTEYMKLKELNPDDYANYPIAVINEAKRQLVENLFAGMVKK